MSETRAQEVVRSQGMCGELLNDGQDICILPSGHGIHGDVLDRAKAALERHPHWNGPPDSLVPELVAELERLRTAQVDLNQRLTSAWQAGFTEGSR